MSLPQINSKNASSTDNDRQNNLRVHALLIHECKGAVENGELFAQLAARAKAIHDQCGVDMQRDYPVMFQFKQDWEKIKQGSDAMLRDLTNPAWPFHPDYKPADSNVVRTAADERFAHLKRTKFYIQFSAVEDRKDTVEDRRLIISAWDHHFAELGITSDDTPPWLARSHPVLRLS